VVLKPKSVSDSAQVPATDATIKFYRAGATVSADVTVPALQPNVPVQVFDPGLLAVNDAVRPGTGAGPGTLIVSGVSPTQLLVSSNMGADVLLGVGTRLVPTNSQPSVYLDPLCTVPLGTFVNADSAGRAYAYLANDRVDYDVSIPGQPLRLYVDGAGLIGRSDRRWNDIRDFGGNLQAAIDALPADGGIVFVPRGTLWLTSGVTVNTPNVTILGEQANSVISVATGNLFDLITARQPNFQMRDVVLDGNASSSDATGKSCLVVQGVGVSGNAVRGVALWNVSLNNAPRYGLWLRDVEDFHAQSCMVGGNRISGVRIEKVSAPITVARFVGGEIGQNLGFGLQAVGVTGVTLVGTTFEHNQVVGGENDGAGVDVESCGRVEIRSCYFENASNQAGAGSKQFVAVRSCPGAVVTECWFQGGTIVNVRPSRAMKFISSRKSRISNTGAAGLADYFAIFDSGSPDCVEFGNIDFAPNPTNFPLQIRRQGLYQHECAMRWRAGIRG